MTETVEAVGAASASDATNQRYDLDQVIDQEEAMRARGADFNKLAEGALSKVIENNFQSDPLREMRSSVSGDPQGDVLRTKSELVSDVARPGSGNTAGGETGDETLATVTDRAQHLYREMTVHHIAWGVATRMQKDISQLLRGG